MRQEEIWDADTARRYETPGVDRFAPQIVGPTVDRLAELAGDGRALEFAIGTGRVALMAALAGFELETRHADWTGGEFTAESRSHVSVYRIPPNH